MYMRNRYYDPQTARFTQEDPIGLGGGLNLYGFAAGDPVTYSDPYGLKIEFADWESQRLYYSTKRAVYDNRDSDDPAVRSGARRLMRMLRELEADEQTLIIKIEPNEVNQTGILRDGSGNFGLWLNPQREGRHSPELLLAHELGHAYAFVRDGFYDDLMSNRRALEVEKYARDMWGCAHVWGGPRSSTPHASDPGGTDEDESVAHSLRAGAAVATISGSILSRICGR